MTQFATNREVTTLAWTENGSSTALVQGKVCKPLPYRSRLMALTFYSSLGLFMEQGRLCIIHSIKWIAVKKQKASKNSQSWNKNVCPVISLKKILLILTAVPPSNIELGMLTDIDSNGPCKLKHNLCWIEVMYNYMASHRSGFISSRITKNLLYSRHGFD